MMLPMVTISTWGKWRMWGGEWWIRCVGFGMILGVGGKYFGISIGISIGT
jgi:hypothetical protein